MFLFQVVFVLVNCQNSVYDIASKKFELFWSKVCKMEANEKGFQSIVITLVRGHICTFLQVRLVTWLRTSRVWLDWIDHWSFILNYRLVHAWSTHTTHKTNVQWMLIPFVWLYMYKCDVYTQRLADQTQNDFWVFYIFLKVSLCFCVFRGIFVRSSRVSSSYEDEDGKNWKHWISDRNFRNCLVRKIYLWNYLHASVAFLRVTSREAYPQKSHVFSFKGQTMTVFQT